MLSKSKAAEVKYIRISPKHLKVFEELFYDLIFPEVNYRLFKRFQDHRVRITAKNAKILTFFQVLQGRYLKQYLPELNDIKVYTRGMAKLLSSKN